MHSLMGNLFGGGASLGRGIGNWGLGAQSDCGPGLTWRDDEFGGACYPETIDQTKVDQIITKSNACPSGQYYDPFQSKCVKDDAAENIQALCPKGQTFGFDAKGNKVCKGPTGVTTPIKTTPVTTQPAVGEDAVDWVPLALIGGLLAVGGYMVYRKKKRAGGFSKNWHDDWSLAALGSALERASDLGLARRG